MRKSMCVAMTCAEVLTVDLDLEEALLADVFPVTWLSPVYQKLKECVSPQEQYALHKQSKFPEECCNLQPLALTPNARGGCDAAGNPMSIIISCPLRTLLQWNLQLTAPPWPPGIHSATILRRRRTPVCRRAGWPTLPIRRSTLAVTVPAHAFWPGGTCSRHIAGLRWTVRLAASGRTTCLSCN
jgi:hypothetical protein